MKNRAALRERVFLSYGSLLIKPPLSRGSDGIMDRTGSLHPEAIMDHGCQKVARDAPCLTQEEPQRTPVPRVYRRLTIPTQKRLRILAVFFYTTYAFDLFSSREDAFLALPVCSCHVTQRDVATHTEE